MDRLRARLPWTFPALAAIALAWAFTTATLPGLRTTPAAAMDFLPLWLGAALVEQGRDPDDAAAAEAEFRAEKLPARPGGFHSYYPPTAPLVAMPLRPLGFRRAVQAWRAFGVFALVSGTALAAMAGFGRRLSPTALGTAGLLAAFALLSRPARVVIPTGQPGPLVVGLTGLALWLLAGERTRRAAAVAALGTAVKLVPIVLLPVLLARRAWAAAFAFAAVLAALVGVLLAFGVPLHPVSWARELLAFSSRDPLPGWRGQTLLFALWQARTPLVAAGSVALLWRLWRAPRPGAALDTTAALIAAVGVLVAGSPHYHEALVLLPAIAHALAWPAQTPRERMAWGGAASILAVCAAQPAAFARGGRPDSLAWVGIGLVVWIVSALRAWRRP